MSAPYRPAVRLLSQRLRHLQGRSPSSLRVCAAPVRHASTRYSSPSKYSPEASVQQFLQDASAAAQSSPSHESHGTLDAFERKRQHHWKRVRAAGVGLLFSTVGVAATVYFIKERNPEQLEKKPRSGYSLDAPDEANTRFQGKDVHVIGLGEGKRIVAEDESGAIDLVETGTSSVPHFPKVMYLPTATESDAQDPNAIVAPNEAGNPGNRANLEEYTLVGLGIRSVSFLSIQVYVVGLYTRTRDLSQLQANLIHFINPTASTLIPSEKEGLQSQLLEPNSSRAIWEELLQVPGIKTAWRVVPTRNTDFMHLRDGWITGINKRTAEAKKRNGNVPSEYDREDFGQSIRHFMSIFKGGKAPKGSIMILSRGKEGMLDVFFTPKPAAGGKDNETQLLGTVNDERISKLIWMNYLAGDKVSSEAARKGVADGCVALASRPVGSVETMVT